MTNATLDDQTARRICNGNQEAWEWMQLGRVYCHEIDDLVDEDAMKASKEAVATRACRIGALALELYSHPFWLKNMPALKLAMMQNTGNYLESVLWEDSKVEWQRMFADWARHGWIDMVLSIAQICGGFQHRMSVAQELRTVSYVDHHDKDGEAK